MRKTYNLFQPQYILELWKQSHKEIEKNGFTLINKHTFANDEPPWIDVTYYSLGTTIAFMSLGETIEYYLIETKKAGRFCRTMADEQNDYCRYHLEGTQSRELNKTQLSSRDYALFNLAKNSVEPPIITIEQIIPSKIK